MCSTVRRYGWFLEGRLFRLFCRPQTILDLITYYLTFLT